MLRLLLICKQLYSEVIDVFGRFARPYLVLHARNIRRETFQAVLMRRPQFAVEGMLQDAESKFMGPTIFQYEQAYERTYDLWPQFSEQINSSKRRAMLIFGVRKLDIVIPAILPAFRGRNDVVLIIQRTLEILQLFPHLQELKVHLQVIYWWRLHGVRGLRKFLRMLKRYQ